VRFSPGDQVAVRAIWYGRISHARPFTVAHDDDDLIALYIEPGAVCKSLTAEGAPKNSWNDLLLAREWSLHDVVWKWSRVLMLARPGRWSSIWGFWGEQGGEPLAWYVNLEEPMRRTDVGFDTRDLQLDLVVMPDHTWTWKDEAEFEEMIDLGLITQQEAETVRAEGEAVIAEIARGDEWWLAWKDWAPDPSWPVPTLPDGWDQF
jgi:hypothetical protein